MNHSAEHTAAPPDSEYRCSVAVLSYEKRLRSSLSTATEARALKFRKACAVKLQSVRGQVTERVRGQVTKRSSYKASAHPAAGSGLGSAGKETGGDLGRIAASARGYYGKRPASERGREREEQGALFHPSLLFLYTRAYRT